MTKPILEARGLCRAFGALVATDNVSLPPLQGEINALIRPSGAPKSTLIAKLSGALAPYAGQVLRGGHDITALPVDKRARAGLARTIQISPLAMEDTVLLNTLLDALGQSGRPWRFLRAALSDKGLRACAEAALDCTGPAGHAASNTARLLHGQRRHLEIAVALPLCPKAILMDEPMAGQGAEGSAWLKRLLDGLRHETPILLMEHDMDAGFALTDRISVLVHGKMIATGT